jgi:hypothetical protein
MDYTVVVSNKNENIEWTNKIKSISIYNDTNEFISYLNYIIEHYESLPSYIVMLKGNPFENNKYVTKDNIVQEIEGLLYNLRGEQTCDAIPFFMKPVIEQQYKFPGIRAPEYYYKFFTGDIPTHFEYNEQNQYIVSKIGIINRDKSFYINLKEMLLNNKINSCDEAYYSNKTFSNDSINPWIMQRIFPYFFDINVTINV